MNTPLTTRHNLPSQPTSFIGRENEITEIVALLADPNCHLLTLVGPGGIGKTRLATEAAQRVEPDDGAFFVSLQPLGSADNIVTTIVDALPLQLHGSTDPQQQLLDYLRERQMLLILDNFEHLLDGVSIVTGILEAASHVKLLVTSREALNLQAEHLWPLGGLDTPPDEALDVFDDYSAVQLFVERTWRVKPDFSPEAYKHEVVRICRLVDGLPLALELAAGWTRALSPQAVGDEIQRSLDFLASNQRDVPQRHRSMRAVFDRSWSLLSAQEQVVFRKLSVFRGGFTAEAAQQVAGASLPLLASLIDKSLLRLEKSGRYDLHELLRQYTEEQLETVGETEATCDAHMDYYTATLSQRETGLKGPGQVEALDDIEADFENIRAVWNRAVMQRNVDIVGQMMEIVTLFFEMRTRHHEGLEFIQTALDTLVEASGATSETIHWWLKLFRLHLWQLRQQTIESTRVQIEEVLAAAHQHQDQRMIALCLYELGEYMMIAGNYKKALPIYEEAFAQYRQLEDRYNAVRTLKGITHCYVWLGEGFLNEWIKSHQEHLDLALEVGDPTGLGHAFYDDAHFILRTQQDRAGFEASFERRLQEAYDLWEKVGNQTHAGAVKVDLAGVAVLYRRDFDRARELIKEAARIADDANDIMLRAFVLMASSHIAIAEEDYSRSERLLQEALAIDDPRTTPRAYFSLGVSYLGQGNYEEARRYLHYHLKYFHERQWTNLIARNLLMSALILAHAGEKVRAAELLGLAFVQRGNMRAWNWPEKIPLFTRRHAELKAELSEETYNAALERGKALDLNTVVHELLTEFKPDAAGITLSQHILEANITLSDPLTPRELEVLRLLADGLANNDIAKQLVITRGTVRGHLNKLYHKLDVKNRVQAITRAQHLGLL
jgi:predicted ATPase/DNA-binding CsgD family transcriptional regulator